MNLYLWCSSIAHKFPEKLEATFSVSTGNEQPAVNLLPLQVRRLKGIGELVKLFNSDHQEVQRFATGAARNLIFENMDNKVELIEEGGIPQLIEALKENDDELRKNITGRKMSDVGGFGLRLRRPPLSRARVPPSRFIVVPACCL